MRTAFLYKTSMSRSADSLNLLFVADPLPNFDIHRETTLWLMHEAARRGHRIFCTTLKGLSAHGKQVSARVEELRVFQPGRKEWYRVRSVKHREMAFFDAVLLRKDPPFDLNYLNHLQLLELASDQIYMMNHPRGLLLGNEKLLPLLYSQLTPETLISADREALMDFIRKQRRGTVIKPLGSSGGRGVFLLKNAKVDNAGVILEAATHDFSEYVIAQAYAPVREKGDRRVMLLGGEILGAFVRRPAPGEHRANLHSGGSAHRSPVLARDQQVAALLRPTLAGLGLDFVGLDMIGDSLIEINVTSPMGLNELNQHGYRRTQSKVLDFLEKRVKNFSPKLA